MRLLLFAFALFTLSLALATPADSDYRASLHPGSSRITTTTTTTKWSYEICGDPTDPIQIDHIHVTPDPPQAGKDLTIILVGNATELLKDGAYADVVVRIGAIKLLQREYDLCEEARNLQLSLQCPVQQGSFNITHTIALPQIIPKSTIKMNVDAYTGDDEPLLCLKLLADFRSSY